MIGRLSTALAALALIACVAPTESTSAPPSAEPAILRVELEGASSDHRYLLGSALPEAIQPEVIRDDRGQTVAVEFELPGPDAYVFAVVEFDRSRGAFEPVLELPLWLDRSAQVSIDFGATPVWTGDLDLRWVEAFQAAIPWSRAAESLALLADEPALHDLDQRTLAAIGTHEDTVAELMKVYRARALAAHLPDAGWLDSLAESLALDDPRWALVAAQLPILARSAADRSAAARLLARLVDANPANSVRIYASTWLVEEAVEAGDHAAEARYRSLLPTRGLGLNFGAEHPLAVGKMAPVLALPDLYDSSRTHGLHDRARPMLIMLWSPWCSWCEDEVPWWTLAHARFGDRLDFLAVAIDGSHEDVMNYMAATPIVGDAAHLEDAQRAILEGSWACPSVPHLVLLDPRGRVVASTRSLRGPELLLVVDEYFAVVRVSPQAPGLLSSSR